MSSFAGRKGRERGLSDAGGVRLPLVHGTLLGRPLHDSPSDESESGDDAASIDLIDLREGPVTPWKETHSPSLKQSDAARSLSATNNRVVPSVGGQVSSGRSAIQSRGLSGRLPIYSESLQSLTTSNAFTDGISLNRFPDQAATPTRCSDADISPDSSFDEPSSAAPHSGLGTSLNSSREGVGSEGRVHSSRLEHTNPLTARAVEETNDRAANHANKGDNDRNAPGTLVKREDPAVWEERRHAHSFRSQRLNKDVFEEVFEDAFNVLGNLNPDHYTMPFGSRVICVKTSSVTNVLLSVKNGIWACSTPVSERMQDLWRKRGTGDEKILLLYSVPGSKQFCGLAEVLDIRPEETTDFWENGDIFKGTMVLKWLFCKLVPYEEVRQVVSVLYEKESATQMWNGMHYSEGVGREVIRAYVQYPHTENLLAKPKFSHGHGQSNKRGNGQIRGQNAGGRFTTRNAGGHNQAQRTHRRDIFSTPRSSIGHAQQRIAEGIASLGVIDSRAQFERAQKTPNKPQLQYMPVYVHADGSITPAGPGTPAASSAPDSVTPASDARSFSDQNRACHTQPSRSPTLDSPNYSLIGGDSASSVSTPVVHSSQNRGRHVQTPRCAPQSSPSYSLFGDDSLSSTPTPSVHTGQNRARYIQTSLSPPLGSPDNSSFEEGASSDAFTPVNHAGQDRARYGQTPRTAPGAFLNAGPQKQDPRFGPFSSRMSTGARPQAWGAVGGSPQTHSANHSPAAMTSSGSVQWSMRVAPGTPNYGMEASVKDASRGPWLVSAPGDIRGRGQEPRHEQLRYAQSFPAFASDNRTMSSAADSRPAVRSYPPPFIAAVPDRSDSITPRPHMGRHLRHAPKSSVDLRMNSMVDNLVESPSRKSDGSRTTASYDGLSNMSDG